MGEETKVKAQLICDRVRHIYGEESIVDISKLDTWEVDNKVSTQNILLDIMLGGGIPRGRVVEVYGNEGSGKTTFCLHLIAEVQRNGGMVAFVDAEHALDFKYARALGVDTDELILSQPDYAEQGLNVAGELVKAGVDLVVVDSVAALVPKAEIEGQIGDQYIGLQARLMSQAMRMVVGAVNRSNSILIFTNQVRDKVRTWGASSEETPGGRALKFYSSIRVRLKKKEDILEGGMNVGSRIVAKTVKNKVFPPYKEALVDIRYGKGFSKEGAMLDTAVELGLISKKGSWYCPDIEDAEFKVQGRNGAIEWLEQNADKYYLIDQVVRDEIYEKGAGVVEVSSDECE